MNIAVSIVVFIPVRGTKAVAQVQLETSTQLIRDGIPYEWVKVEPDEDLAIPKVDIFGAKHNDPVILRVLDAVRTVLSDNPPTEIREADSHDFRILCHAA